jgi:cell division GTPase FtsZ
MINSLLVVIGDPAITLIRDLNDEIKMPRIFLSDKRGENIFNLPTNLIYIIESEKITTEYDDKFRDIMENFMFYDHYFILSDIGDEFSTSASKSIGKLYGDKCTGVFIYPFNFEGGNRINNANSFISQIGSYIPHYFILRNDFLFKVFPNIPMKSLPRMKGILLYNLVENFSEGLQLEDLSYLKKGELGFGIGLNERMDLLGESLNDAMDSPWISKDHNNALILFNGNISEEDVSKIKDKIKFKNYKIKINKINKGRIVYILIITW